MADLGNRLDLSEVVRDFEAGIVETVPNFRRLSESETIFACIIAVYRTRSLKDV